MRRGAISFEDREAKVLVDENGHPQDILLRTRGEKRCIFSSFGCS
jgi:ribonuclease R